MEKVVMSERPIPLRIYLACGHSFLDEQTVDADLNVVECGRLSPVYEVVHHETDGAHIYEYQRETINCIRCGTEQDWKYIPFE